MATVVHLAAPTPTTSFSARRRRCSRSATPATRSSTSRADSGAPASAAGASRAGGGLPARARFELWISDPPVELTAADDLAAAPGRADRDLRRAARGRGAGDRRLPQPHDGHHAHEVVARAARAALERLGDDAPRWWLWGLWSDVQIPSLLTSFDTARLEEMLEALEAYEGELQRNDYRVLLEARSEMTAIIGAERIFGFGSRRLDAPYAELLAELVRHDGAWRLGRPRRLDPVRPFAPPGPPSSTGGWTARACPTTCAATASAQSRRLLDDPRELAALPGDRRLAGLLGHEPRARDRRRVSLADREGMAGVGRRRWTPRRWSAPRSPPRSSTRSNGRDSGVTSSASASASR